MNIRIRELAEQNGFIHNWMPPGEQYELLQRYEKFAELIIKECSEHAMTFNYNILSLNDKEIRSHNHRVGDYIKDRMGLK